MIGTVAVRAARATDIDAMEALINGYAREDRMLLRDRAFLEHALSDFVVAEDASSSPPAFLGCCALASLTADLGEVRSLAVTPAAAGRGIGRDLVVACVAAARQRGLRRVFALTLVPDFFVKCGFTLTSLARLPEKSAEECPVCPKRLACDEQAMLLHLDGSRPVPLAPGEPVGYTRLVHPGAAP
ncbi:MAG TPA: GNAT family N-acetyltransferase [Candidatus Saccharimonadales bacterium]|nr:GNAT family N-acetyltransferase [Candidatus Saccharimonadales bacterium]